jgi:hypothetical protein
VTLNLSESVYFEKIESSTNGMNDMTSSGLQFWLPKLGLI